MPYKKLRQKSRATDRPDTRRHSIKLITWKEKEEKDLTLKSRSLFHQKKNKKRLLNRLSSIPNIITMNKDYSRKESKK